LEPSTKTQAEERLANNSKRKDKKIYTYIEAKDVN
jgi:hypothetical protein